MDYTPGKGDSSNLPKYDRPPEPQMVPGVEQNEIVEIGPAMSRLEADLGLARGTLAIRERGARNQTAPHERSAPAPYYQENNQPLPPRPGTIPALPPRKSEPAYDVRDSRRQVQEPNPIYYEPRQQYTDQRGYRPYDPRLNDPRLNDPRYRRQGDRHKQQWWDKSNYPDPGRFQPSRNPELDYLRQQWWQRGEFPTDPRERFQPSRNPELDQLRQEWWRRSQNPPGFDFRNPRQDDYRDQYRDQYRDPYRDQYQSQEQNQRLYSVMNQLLGKSVDMFDRSVPTRLGCARAVSLALEAAYGVPIRDQGCEALESNIRRFGWVQVDPGQIREGDVIIGYRGPGEYGHAAIYVGNDQIYNNNSNSGRMQIDSMSKFRGRDFRQVRVYRKMR